MDKPEEAGAEVEPRGWHLSYLVLVLAIPMLYLASAGPVAYFVVRHYETSSGGPNTPPKVNRVVSVVFKPAVLTSEAVHPYARYIGWFVDRALEADHRKDPK